MITDKFNDFIYTSFTDSGFSVCQSLAFFSDHTASGIQKTENGITITYAYNALNQPQKNKLLTLLTTRARPICMTNVKI